MSEKPFASGQCLCGKISYTISAPPRVMSQCHCDDCRKATGTGHASNAFFKRNQVHIKGAPRSYASTADSGSPVTRYFCPDCGTPLFGELGSLKNVLAVAVGSMDDSSWFKPTAIVYHKSKPDWDFMDNSIAVYEAMPPTVIKSEN
ncbi:GFA family protein [Methyloprofundus sp.]|uniref:GFA family protein n=1 Tax=Methyloprofundus sp. TaxID=2020875 RepID=UPI003D0C7F0B